MDFTRWGKQKNRLCRTRVDSGFQEIAALTQRCSDLQFQLTMQERAAKVEDELRARLAEVERVAEEERRGRAEANDALVELVGKRDELEASLAWERLEWRNRTEGLEARLVEKEDMIEKLKAELVRQVGDESVLARICSFTYSLV